MLDLLSSILPEYFGPKVNEIQRTMHSNFADLGNPTLTPIAASNCAC